jgi:hypothetical protein
MSWRPGVKEKAPRRLKKRLLSDDSDRCPAKHPELLSACELHRTHVYGWNPAHLARVLINDETRVSVWP